MSAIIGTSSIGAMMQTGTSWGAGNFRNFLDFSAHGVISPPNVNRFREEYSQQSSAEAVFSLTHLLKGVSLKDMGMSFSCSVTPTRRYPKTFCRIREVCKIRNYSLIFTL
jgi:hypothetical protein